MYAWLKSYVINNETYVILKRQQDLNAVLWSLSVVSVNFGWQVLGANVENTIIKDPHF